VADIFDADASLHLHHYPTAEILHFYLELSVSEDLIILACVFVTQYRSMIDKHAITSYAAATL